MMIIEGSLALALQLIRRYSAFVCSAQGFEEIHVPALRQKPYASDEKDRAIADLPDWMQPAFKGMKSLNRIQSKVRQTAAPSAGCSSLATACFCPLLVTEQAA